VGKSVLTFPVDAVAVEYKQNRNDYKTHKKYLSTVFFSDIKFQQSHKNPRVVWTKNHKKKNINNEEMLNVKWYKNLEELVKQNACVYV